ncbi:hypothetical protein EDB85DRAFT_1900222 [Lactarius pseudohatsudake]|nr:hypothetical protein EDB85DRAFT_1900222 [Lactarius pseudohatsudake]
MSTGGQLLWPILKLNRALVSLQTFVVKQQWKMLVWWEDGVTVIIAGNWRIISNKIPGRGMTSAGVRRIFLFRIPLARFDQVSMLLNFAGSTAFRRESQFRMIPLHRILPRERRDRYLAFHARIGISNVFWRHTQHFFFTTVAQLGSTPLDLTIKDIPLAPCDIPSRFLLVSARPHMPTSMTLQLASHIPLEPCVGTCALPARTGSETPHCFRFTRTTLVMDFRDSWVPIRLTNFHSSSPRLNSVCAAAGAIDAYGPFNMEELLSALQGPMATLPRRDLLAIILLSENSRNIARMGTVITTATTLILGPTLYCHRAPFPTLPSL